MLVTLFMSTKTKHSHNGQTWKDFQKPCLKMKKRKQKPLEKSAKKSEKATLLIQFQTRPWINNPVN